MMFQIQFDSLGLPLINTSSKSLSFGLGELFVLETSTKQMLLSSCTTTESKVVVPPHCISHGENNDLLWCFLQISSSASQAEKYTPHFLGDAFALHF